ncbi:hypothetical protein Bca101_047400 [Brassica carinata]
MSSFLAEDGTKEMGVLAGNVYMSDLSELFNWTCKRCNGFTKAYVGVAKDLNAIIIAFRGTQEHSIQNWVSDLFWKQLDLNYPDMSDAMVHHGFYSAYHNTTVRPAVLGAVQRAKKSYGPNINIMVTGHSMGGAMATFCGLDLVNGGEENVQVMTFGQPRVGNAAFASYYSLLVPNTFRITHDHDIVPHLPPYYNHFPQKTYHHFPTEVWLRDVSSLNHSVEKVCDNTGEDPTCSRSVKGNSISDHLSYFGVELHCETWRQCSIVMSHEMDRFSKKDSKGNLIMSRTVPSTNVEVLKLKSYDGRPVYNHTLALTLVEYTSAVYMSDLAQLFTWTCERCNGLTKGFQVIEIIVDIEYCLQAYVGVAKDLNAIIIAFRGTQEHSIQNWISDLFWKQLDLNYPDMPDAMVHHGFYTAYHNTTVRPAVLGAVKLAKKFYGANINTIMVTGHSMGGAMAAFCGLDLVVNEGEENVQVMTFGQPRIGNADFASYYSLLVPNTFRITHDHDIVPHLPPYFYYFPRKTYHHFPTEVWVRDLSVLKLVRFGVEKVCDNTGEDPTCCRILLWDWSAQQPPLRGGFNATSLSHLLRGTTYLFDSLKEATVMKCGHTMHCDCYHEMLKRDKFCCPICSRSVIDMSKTWQRMDEEVEAIPMPSDYRDKKMVGQRHRATRTDVRRSLEVQTAMTERQTTTMMRRCNSKLEPSSPPPPPPPPLQHEDMHIPPILLCVLKIR